MAHARLTLACAACLVACSCGAGNPAPALPVSPTPIGSASSPASFRSARWGTYHSRRFELSLGLPDGAAWKIDDHRSSWLQARHEGTSSTLSLRSWGEEQNVTRKGCYARAREWDPRLPDLDGAALIDDGLRPLLKNQDARVAVGVVAAPALSTGGFVVAIAGAIRRCMVVVFQTEARGPAAQDEVADRLVLVSDRLLPSLALDQSFAPSREPVTGPLAPGGVGRVR